MYFLHTVHTSWNWRERWNRFKSSIYIIYNWLLLSPECWINIEIVCHWIDITWVLGLLMSNFLSWFWCWCNELRWTQRLLLSFISDKGITVIFHTTCHQPCPPDALDVVLSQFQRDESSLSKSQCRFWSVYSSELSVLGKKLLQYNRLYNISSFGYIWLFFFFFLVTQRRVSAGGGNCCSISGFWYIWLEYNQSGLWIHVQWHPDVRWPIFKATFSETLNLHISIYKRIPDQGHFSC